MLGWRKRDSKLGPYHNAAPRQQAQKGTMIVTTPQWLKGALKFKTMRLVSINDPDHAARTPVGAQPPGLRSKIASGLGLDSDLERKGKTPPTQISQDEMMSRLQKNRGRMEMRPSHFQSIAATCLEPV